MLSPSLFFFFFFFNDTATTEIYTLSLHDALPISLLDHKMHCGNMTDAEALDLLINRGFQSEGEALAKVIRAKQSACQLSTYFVGRRSEEHTSELQSQFHLVCRLLLEKKKKKQNKT